MSGEWRPGDVGVIVSDTACRGKRAMFCADGDDRRGWAVESTDGLSMAYASGELRPLAVIDPEDREQVERLAKAHHTAGHVAKWEEMHSNTREGLVDEMQAALCDFAKPTPPKPEVYQHLATARDFDGTRRAACGKVWKPIPDVTVVGRCPECVDATESGWVA